MVNILIALILLILWIWATLICSKKLAYFINSYNKIKSSNSNFNRKELWYLIKKFLAFCLFLFLTIILAVYINS